MSPSSVHVKHSQVHSQPVLGEFLVIPVDDEAVVEVSLVGPRQTENQCTASIPGYDMPVVEASVEVPRQAGDPLTTSQEFAELARLFNFKQCPACGNACEKEDEDSCDHMTCICGKEFCWSCLADRTVILHHGNHYHNPDCRFYVPYNGAAEFVEKCPECKRNGKACLPPKLTSVSEEDSEEQLITPL